MQIRNTLRRLIPTKESLQSNRWLKWIRPLLHDPRLWHVSRRGIAMGLALGVFFGLLVPVAQIPVSAGAAVLLRANVPMAAASTFITNPVTFGPVYYGAYRLGKVVLGEKPVTEAQAAAQLAQAQLEPVAVDGFFDRVQYSFARLKGVGKPLVVGVTIIATVSGVLTYFVVSGVWILKTRWMRKKRQSSRKGEL